MIKEKCQKCNNEFSWLSINTFADKVLVKIDLWGLESCNEYEKAMYRKQMCPACAGYCTHNELIKFENNEKDKLEN
ncbi:MAG: hypothetical protein K0R54_726 [Clostridiaceae bacterium]|jgi:hypothetical protein|nr:hypothetical protein [Clostridiaceae bacterium]